jgi:hypothetical protein
MDYPYYGISNSDGKIILTIPDLEIIEDQKNDSLQLIIEGKDFIPKRLNVSRIELKRKKTFYLNPIYLAQNSRASEVDEEIFNLIKNSDKQFEKMLQYYLAI